MVRASLPRSWRHSTPWPPLTPPLLPAGPLLGPIFADPGKLKVLHGSDCDIVWLQRDFGIYVANLFDTGQAARVLQYPGHGLAFLMDHFCSIKVGPG